MGLLALIMGMPFTKGGFVGGDDHRLLLNHVLVNHPSWDHAVQLFTVVHRDLYQPIPLLTFSAEFALAEAMGLFAKGVEGGAWLFHLTNVFLHAVNAVLVFFVVSTLHRNWQTGLVGSAGSNEKSPSSALNPEVLSVAAFAGILFAIHPLQVEVVAWLNGRMMLLSTLFALAAMLAFNAWLRAGRWPWVAATLVLVLACMMSKVRVGVPVLLLLVAIVQRHRLNLRLAVPWLAVAAITGVFILINLKTTADSDFFSLAGEHMTGPRVVRVMRSLAWYFEHVVWPTGLASWYPAPPHVAWEDAETLGAIMILCVAAALLFTIARKSLPACLGIAWFLCTLVDTLPIVPARNLLAADRYMYLSIIGLLWVGGIAFCRVIHWLQQLPSARRCGPIAVVLAFAVCSACIGQSWHTGSFYAKAIPKTRRIAELFPNTPHVWARLGWAYHKSANAAQEGRQSESEALYAEAIACAERELKQPNPKGWSEAHQVLGASKLKLGHTTQALEHLHKAVELDPQNVEPIYWLAWAYDELGNGAAAIPLFEAALKEAPGHNPSLLRLAKLYKDADRHHDAATLYSQALNNNPYEAPAVLGLAEAEVESGELDSAKARLTSLLSWMPENVAARTLYGVVLQRQGSDSQAQAEYEAVLRQDPNQVAAALNLAQMARAAGDAQRAKLLYERAASGQLESVEQVVELADYFLESGADPRALAIWDEYLSQTNLSPRAAVEAAWFHARMGDATGARQLLAQGAETDPLSVAVRLYVSLLDRDFTQARQHVEAMAVDSTRMIQPRARVLGALERFDRQRPNDPWTFAVVARLLRAEGKPDAFKVFLELATNHCRDPECSEYVAELRDLP